jgi:hypothetical protein
MEPQQLSGALLQPPMGAKRLLVCIVETNGGNRTLKPECLK